MVCFQLALRLLVALSGFVVVAFGTAAGGRLSRWELKLGINTLIANILVLKNFSVLF